MRNPALLTGRSIHRRQLLQAGGLSLLSLSLSELEVLRAAAPGNAKGRRNSCVFLFLFGGPSQIDLWDMKPEAPAEVRGEFQPKPTKVPGIRICGGQASHESALYP